MAKRNSPVRSGIVLSFFLALLIACPARAEATSFLFSSPKPLPPLVYEDANGAQHALSDFYGSFLLINVWATWCPTCAKEMAGLNALQPSLAKENFRVLALSQDTNDGVVPVFFLRHKIKNLDVAYDRAKRAVAVFNLKSLPATIIIDPLGNEIARAEGVPDWTAPEVRQQLLEIANSRRND